MDRAILIVVKFSCFGFLLSAFCTVCTLLVVTMSSGTLPLATYHRAQALGSGTYGSVVAVYNDEGEEYALKLFLEDDDDEEEEEEVASTLVHSVRFPF